MRLLDPLNGVKFGQMHIGVHLTFFVTMFFINTEYTQFDPRPVKKHHEETKKHETKLHDKKKHHEVSHISLNNEGFYSGLESLYVSQVEEAITEKDRVLNKISNHHEDYAAEAEEELKSKWEMLIDLSLIVDDPEEHLTPKQEYEKNLLVYKILQWTHFGILIAQIIIQYAKQKDYHDLAQSISALILLIGVTPLMFNIWFSKTRIQEWKTYNEWNDLRIFLFIETIWFFEWITMGVAFLVFAYLLKFKPITKEEKIKHAVDNPWNRKYSDDFMRYVKAEMYNLCYIFTKLSMNLLVGFLNIYNISQIGKRDLYPTGIFFIVLIIDNIGLIVFYLYTLSTGLQIYADYFKTLWKAYWGCHAITIIVTYSIFFSTNCMDGQSAIVRVWGSIVCVEQVFDMCLAAYWTINIYQPEEKRVEALQKKSSQVKLNVNDELRSSVLSRIRQKDQMEYEEDFTTMACFCFLKKNVDEFLIGPDKRAQLYHSALAIQANVVAMILCVFYAIYTNEGNRYNPMFAHNFPLFYVKIACVMALHFVIYPEVSKGLNIMKLANQHPDMFVENGSNVSYILGFIQVLTAMVTEGVNLYMLAFQHTIQHCIIHFVAFEVIIELSNMYYESLMNNILKEVVEHPPKLAPDRWGENKKVTQFSERSCLNKFCRVLYIILRCIYVAVNFYFAPFIVIYWQFLVHVPEGLQVHHG